MTARFLSALSQIWRICPSGPGPTGCGAQSCQIDPGGEEGRSVTQCNWKPTDSFCDPNRLCHKGQAEITKKGWLSYVCFYTIGKDSLKEFCACSKLGVKEKQQPNMQIFCHILKHYCQNNQTLFRGLSQEPIMLFRSRVALSLWVTFQGLYP